LEYFQDSIIALFVLELFSLWVLRSRWLPRLCGQWLQGMCNIHSITERWCITESGVYCTNVNL